MPEQIEKVIRIIKSYSMRLWIINPSICLMIVLSLLSLFVSTLGLLSDYFNSSLADSRWIKPFKFGLSLSLYGMSMLLISKFLSQDRKLLYWTSMFAFIGSTVELAAIFFQSLCLHPVILHPASLFAGIESILWYTIKLAIMPVAFSDLVMLAMLLRQKSLPPVLGSAICWGALLAALGFIPGFMMLMPEALQHPFSAEIAINNKNDLHTLLNPSGADLRIAHFVGLHALQIFPLLAIYINSLKLSKLRKELLVSNFGYTYSALILTLVWQAMKNEPIVTPSLQTLAVLLVIFSLSIVCAVMTLFSWRCHQFVRVVLRRFVFP